MVFRRDECSRIFVQDSLQHMDMDMACPILMDGKFSKLEWRINVVF